ncbi:MAG: ATP-dependent DNA helicase RecG [Candidatus Yanofskybacteria bacterium CG10_big_fil_rev_8_21_14_0_10_46_23]|uniref:ATP-dependent DNA helicase RecG n=1 Tax=Candidatus Yanofskybacteria bacterium CG10_big_fil_rev_8_21_14_0_10_46_23 TaxID=1975098 RepID=A0A2H0R438_9BACT|nr:MAG: ATP-dependent DNA helicase RecG [Candidatus Yanofskybacteria bacterium CG10_big_fil_rev_8_21_14_0_10_46_23]
MLELDSPITELKFVGPKNAQLLAKLKITTVENLLYHLPARYLDYRVALPIDQLQKDQEVSIAGEITAIETVQSWRRGRRPMKIVTAHINDGTETVRAIWFNQTYIADTLTEGTAVRLAGVVKLDKKGLFFSSPVYEKVIPGQTPLHTGRLIAQYPQTYGVTSKYLRMLVQQVFEKIGELSDPLPLAIRERYRLPELKIALAQVHAPGDFKEATEAKNRLAFDQIFLFQLKTLRTRRTLRQLKAPQIKFNPAGVKLATEHLPFKLTNDQRLATYEILTDLEKSYPMNRLLNGDVGSGKTVVAILAAQQVAQAGLQVAVLAPTEILAQQHYQTFKNFLKNTAVRIDLLTASAKAKKEVIRLINNDFAQIVIGTHALIQDKVAFPNLGLVIIDEQHRFGIKQRARLLKNATTTPHLLSMTATPIPRTLALTMYGDLDISLIQEKPQGRQKIKTRLVAPAHKKMAYRFIDQEIAQGRQVFVICPRIELPELTTIPDLIKQEVKAVMAEHENLSKNHFPHRRVGLLHGRLKAREKQAVMTDFATGHLDILVSTSVVEVGVDVPNASVMAIENAEHFGLAQLHQFRGRVGRAQHQSHCFLLSGSPQKQENQRLKALVESDDGFALAEMDLQLRGPGQFFGAQQSGQPDLPMISLTDLSLIKKARSEAKQFLKTDPNFAKHPRLKQAFINFQKIHHFE